MKKTLEEIYGRVSKDLTKSLINDKGIAQKIESICRCNKNKAPIRFLMSGLLSKISDPTICLYKPYSALGEHSFTGRTNDEEFVQPFIHEHSLPCNSTTAYLTPAFRTIEKPLTKDFFNKCRPKEVYYDMMDVLDFVEQKPNQAYRVLEEIIRLLIIVKNENRQRINQLLQEVKDEESELSSEEITALLIQHLNCNGSSRLPVLIIAAAYQAVQDLIKEQCKPLYAHNAADSQTGALGDIEIVTEGDEHTVTCYEMKKKKVTTDDIAVCKNKIISSKEKIDNYIIITTDSIDFDVINLAKTCYGEIGVEIVVLDCIGFINHFLHFFHRHRIKFLNKYQELLLSEPDSSVSQPLKEAFLTLRRVAETDKNS